MFPSMIYLNEIIWNYDQKASSLSLCQIIEKKFFDLLQIFHYSDHKGALRPMFAIVLINIIVYQTIVVRDFSYT